MKKILFILRRPPHCGAYTQEMLDIVMTAAAFDQEVSLLLLDHAVFQLKKHQTLDSNGLKDTSAIFKALSLYNIRGIYVESESLSEQGIASSILGETVIEIPRNRIGSFVNGFDLVIPG